MEKELIYLEENDDPIFEDGRIWMYLTDDDKVRALMDSNHTDYLAKYEDWFEMCSLKCYVTYCPKDESIKLVVHPIVFEEGDKTLVNELLKKYDKYDLETNEIALTEEEKTLITNQVKEYVERKGLLNAFKEYEDGLKTDSDYQFYFNCLKDDVNKMKQCETKQDLVDWLVDYIDNKGCRNILDVLDGKDKDYPSLEDWTEEFCFNEIAEWIEEARESDEETLTSDELWNVIEMFANEEYENGSEMLDEIKESEELEEDRDDLGER